MKRIAKVNERDIQFNLALASELGVEESLVLLLLDSLFTTHEAKRKGGHYWVYLTDDEIEDLFPFWDTEYVMDLLVNLSMRDLIVIKTRPNGIRVRFDESGFSELNSVILVDFENKNTLKSILISRTQADVREADKVIDDPGPMQAALIQLHKVRKPKAVPQEIDKIHFNVAYDICYGTDTLQAIAALSTEQRARVTRALGKIIDAGGDLNRLRDFEQWWRSDWRSGKDQYQLPRPEQMLEHWFEAMKTVRPVKPQPEAYTPVGDIEERMRQRAKQRRG